MRTLVTGGAGFIGSHLVEQLVSEGPVRVLDDLSSGTLENLRDFPIDFHQGSILDESEVASSMSGIDCVFHLAALVSVPRSFENPRRTVHINTIGTLNCLHAAAEAGVKTFVLASSAAVYGNDPSSPKTESMPPQPESPYAVTKLDAEYYCRLFMEERGLRTVSLRFFNVFGPRQNPASGYAAVIPSFIAKARQNEPLIIHGDGGQTRDFIFVKDIVAALVFVAKTPEAKGTYNCGYGDSLRIADLAAKIIELTGSTAECRHAPHRAGDVRHSRADPSRLRKIGWKPMFDRDFGLTETVKYNQI